jgi:hypothetical protein
MPMADPEFLKRGGGVNSSCFPNMNVLAERGPLMPPGSATACKSVLLIMTSVIYI